LVSTWVFKVKRNSESVERYKAIVVAKGFSQAAGGKTRKKEEEKGKTHHFPIPLPSFCLPEWAWRRKLHAQSGWGEEEKKRGFNQSPDNGTIRSHTTLPHGTRDSWSEEREGGKKKGNAVHFIDDSHHPTPL